MRGVGLKILDHHIGRELLWPFVFGVTAFTSIFFAGQNLLKLTSQVLAGMPAMRAMEMVLLSLPGVIVYTLPMSALLAVLVAFSRLSNDSEVVAMYACGVSLYRAIVPVIWLGILVTGFGFFMSEVAVPTSNRALKELQAHVLKEEISTNRPFVFIDKDTHSTIYVAGGFNSKAKTMRQVTITRYNEKDEPVIMFHAKSAHWEGGSVWTLSDGDMKAVKPGGNEVSATFGSWKTEQVKINQSPKDIAMRQMGPEDMTYRELRSYIADLSGGEDKLIELKVQLYNKLAIPFAALVFAMIGAPLAIRPSRSGASVGIGLSILIIFGYWFVWHLTSALASQGSLPPVVGAFAADVLGLGVGALLLVRTSK